MGAGWPLLPPIVPYLVHLSLLELVGRGGRSSPFLARSVAEVEIGVAEATVPIHVVEAFPNHLLLLQEALVRHQQVKVALGRGEKGQWVPASPRWVSKEGGEGAGAAPCALSWC